MNIDHILKMRSSILDNYIIPGVSNSLLENGKVRLLESSRDHQENVAPHSHRFDLLSLVLRGSVENHIWHETPNGDEFLCETLKYRGAPGEYRSAGHRISRFTRTTQRYTQGGNYFMNSKTIHSIKLSKGAIVLLFEGPEVSDESVMLRPYVDGQLIPDSGMTRSWMFKKREDISK